MATRLSDPKQAFTGVDEAVVGRKAGITKQTIQLSYGVYKTVDAKLMRSAKTKLFGKHATPLLTSGIMPPTGYGGQLVPPHARTVYNASLISARPAEKLLVPRLRFVRSAPISRGERSRVCKFLTPSRW